MPHQHHIIVGDGVTAAEFATTREMTAGDTLTIIGSNIDQPGRGVAYARAPVDAPWRYAYLFNSPSYAVDAEFAAWLSEHWADVKACMHGRTPDWLAAAKPYTDIGDIAALNAPRELYGDFCQRRTEAGLARLRQNGITVNLLKTTVTTIKSVNLVVAHAEGAGIERASVDTAEIKNNGSKLQVDTAAGHTLYANTVDIATGGPINQSFAGSDSNACFPELFGFEEAIADRLKSGINVISIGANAAMLDLLRFCQSVLPEQKIQLTAISPTGTLPFALRPSAARRQTSIDLKGPYHRAQDFLDDLYHHKDNALANGDSLEEIRAGLRTLFMTTSLTEFIPNTAEARKVAKPLYRNFQGGTRDSVDDFKRLQASDNTKLLAGKVLNIKDSTQGATVTFEDTTGCVRYIRASVVVNCAGPGPEATFDPLTNSLIRQSFISRCPHSGGIIVGADCHTSLTGVRYLGPAVTCIGETPEPVPFYDALKLRMTVQRINSLD